MILLSFLSSLDNPKIWDIVANGPNWDVSCLNLLLSFVLCIASSCALSKSLNLELSSSLARLLILALEDMNFLAAVICEGILSVFWGYTKIPFTNKLNIFDNVL